MNKHETIDDNLQQVWDMSDVSFADTKGNAENSPSNDWEVLGDPAEPDAETAKPITSVDESGVYVTRRELIGPVQLNGKKMLCCSDIHLSPSAGDYDKSNLRNILQLAKTEQPDYIVIGGDFLDTLETFYSPQARQLFTSFLTNLSDFAPVFLGVGNHDYTLYDQRNWQFYSKEGFDDYKGYVNNINSYIQLLDNAAKAADDKTTFAGLTLPPEYYGCDEVHRENGQWVSSGAQEFKTELKKGLLSIITNRIDRRHQPTREDRATLEKVLQDFLDQSLFEQVEDDNDNPYRVLLIHSPLFLDPEIIKKLRQAGVDIVISGHMHNGAVPVMAQGLAKRLGGIGLTSPDGSLLTRHAMNGSEDRPDEHPIILGPVALVPDNGSIFTSKAFRNPHLYPAQAEVLKFVF